MKTTLYLSLIVACISSSLFTGHGLFAQNVGINSTGATAHPSALLDLDASASPSVGLLVPRISLSLTTLPAPVTSPANSLLVYNLATTTSTAAVSPGYYYWDGTKWVRLQTSNNTAQDWNLLGNAGTVDGTHFIGTTDNVPFNIRVNNAKAGRIDGVLNTYLGLGAGDNNTATNTSAFGADALHANTTGVFNTALGCYALRANTTGSMNVASGYGALFSNTTGNSNTAHGVSALYHNTTGYANTATGVEALYSNTTGSQNMANGYGSLHSNTTGNMNTASGNASLLSTTTGSNNTASGNASGSINTVGSNNTFIGANADANANNLTNATAIGYNAIVGQSNALILGGTGASSVNVGIGTSTPSEKLEIQGSVKIVDGTQGVGRVLTSDANGKGSWSNTNLINQAKFNLPAAVNNTITQTGTFTDSYLGLVSYSVTQIVYEANFAGTTTHWQDPTTPNLRANSSIRASFSFSALATAPKGFIVSGTPSTCVTCPDNFVASMLSSTPSSMNFIITRIDSQEAWTAPFSITGLIVQ